MQPYWPAEGDVYSAYFATLRRNGARWHQPMLTKTNAQSGSLRLVRNGETLEYFVAEGESRDFRLIRRVRLGSEDVAVVRVGVDKGGSAGAIEGGDLGRIDNSNTSIHESDLVVGTGPGGRTLSRRQREFFILPSPRSSKLGAFPFCGRLLTTQIAGFSGLAAIRPVL